MKKGLFIYKARNMATINIGDYIQSLAAEQFTGRNVAYIEREETNEYAGDPLQVIMNGWYMELPQNWPPSKAIFPLLTSIHINPDISEQMLNEKAVAYLKDYVAKFGSIGARDKGTQTILKDKGIDAHFSGCLTLTLAKSYKNNPEGKRVCFVDTHQEKKIPKGLFALIDCGLKLITKKSIVSIIAHKLYGNRSLKNLLRACSFYRTYSTLFEDEVFKQAEYINHLVKVSHFRNEEEKFEFARTLLAKYAESRLVITSRIHAALPCLAMGTPVLFVVGDDLQPTGKGMSPSVKGRFEGLLELFHVLENVNYKLRPVLGFNVDKKIGVNHNIRNKKNHLPLAEALANSCVAFINNEQVSQEHKVFNSDNVLAKR